MKSWFISDLHLKDEKERNVEILLRFLFELGKSPKENRLFLLGDIFDVWVSDGKVFSDKFKKIVEALVSLKKNGAEIHYFEGNHDVHISKFWSDQFGIPVHTVGQNFKIDSLWVRAEHGDYINPEDAAYLKWLKILRSPVMEFMAHALPGVFWKTVAEKYSNKSRKKSSRYAAENAERVRFLIREYAKSAVIKNDFDLIVTGHMHVFDVYEFFSRGKSVRSVNLGTWLEKPRVLKVENSKIEIIELN